MVSIVHPFSIFNSVMTTIDSSNKLVHFLALLLIYEHVKSARLLLTVSLLLTIVFI